MSEGARVVGIVQARMSSTRLPGKTLADVDGRPLLARLMHRVAACAEVRHWVVATGSGPDDDAIEALCDSLRVPCHRGSLDDVLERYWQAACGHRAEHVVRVTADCPLLHPEVIDRVVGEHLRGGWDYTSNTLEPSYPDGMDVEVMRNDVLQQCREEALRPSQREHVTLWIKQHPDRFRLHNVRDGKDRSALRLTVDEAADLDLVRRIFAALGGGDGRFEPASIYSLLAEQPDLVRLNAHIARDEGLRRSLEREAPQEANP